MLKTGFKQNKQMMRTRIIILSLLLNVGLLSVFSEDIPEADFIVAKDGTGDFTTVQNAINTVPDNSSEYTLIYIKNGIYEEALNVGSGKRNVVLYGANNNDVIITYATEKTLDLATLEVYATGFIAFNLTIENTAGPSYGPAQALRQEADKSIYINCRLIGNQDTYRTGKARSYSKNCYYEGTVDFIFGDGSFVFENCEIYSKGGTAITAASTKDYADFGYVFRNCRVVSKTGTNTHLGRPWRDYAAVAFINCELPDEIMNAGWHNWDEPAREETSRFAEYKNYGPGSDISNRVDWAEMLTTEEAEQYNTLNVLKSTYNDPPSVDNWNPYADIINAGITGLNLEGDGYGRNEGGNGGTVVTVANEANLRSYATSDSKYIIQVSGNIELTERLDVGSNTTITGINAESGISGATVNIADETSNVIVKYLNISNPGGDGISVWNGHNVFITHISFYDCGDGCCDINRGSDSVTVSWCKFYYPEQADHRFTMIADGSMTWNDQGEVISYGNKLHLTLHHNWWYTRADQRMPASTNANIHLYNNYLNCVKNSYCSNARHLSEFYLENNYYDNVNNACYSESGGKIYTNGNVYNHCTGKISDGNDSVFIPAYSYLLTSVNSVPNVVTARAGNTWDNPQQFTLTALSNGNGYVSPMGSAIYNEGQLATFTAQPFDNYGFVNWTGDMESVLNPLVFFPDSSYEISANFEAVTWINEFFPDNENILIYPNPSFDGNFNIRLTTGEAGESFVKIYNRLGMLVFEKNYFHADGIVDIQLNLERGLYLVCVASNSETYTALLNVR